MLHLPQGLQPSSPRSAIANAASPVIVQVEVDGVSYAVHRREGGDPLPITCVAPPREAFPSYLIRRRIRNALGPLGIGRTIVFTDSGHSAEIWSWQAGSEGTPVSYRERLVQAGFVLRGAPAVVPIRNAADRAAGALLRDEALAIHLPWIVLRRTRGTLSAATQTAGFGWRLVQAEPDRYGVATPEDLLGGSPPIGMRLGPQVWQLLQDVIEDPSGPGSLRAVWRAVSGVRVLDRNCADGEWLLDALEVLAHIYTACLEQMRVWVGETGLRRNRSRADHIRDFRHALFRAGDAGGSGAFGREASALLNLHAIAGDPASAAECRRRIGARLRAGRRGDDALPANALNIRVGDPGLGISSLRDLSSALARSSEHPGTLHRVCEEAEAIGRADAFLRTMRFGRDMPRASLRAGMHRIHHRVRALSAELNLLVNRRTADDSAELEGSQSPPGAARPLHIFFEWQSVIRSGGFHLVREGQ